MSHGRYDRESAAGQRNVKEKIHGMIRSLQRERFEDQQEITTLTVIWARQLGAGPVAERARAVR